MHRPRFTALALFVLTVALAGCSSPPPEETLISSFFRASRFRDNMTSANLSMVTFSSAERGVVSSFEVESISEETTAPMRARALNEALMASQASESEFSERKQAYQDENLEAIERVLEAEQAGNEPSRRADRAVQEEWTQWRGEMAQHAQEVSDARAALSEGRIVAEGSTYSAIDLIDVTLYDGEISSKTVRIIADVITPDEQNVQQTLDIEIQRAELVGDDGTPLTGRWIITAIDEVS